MGEQESAVTLRAAAIEAGDSSDADALLAGVAARMQHEGWRVRGLLMTYPDGRQTCAAPMVLVDLQTQQPYLVSQSLGSGSNGCRVDPQGFARASEVLRHALDEAPDLVICNRFGGLEAAGGGFCQELLALLSSDLPVLTAVSPRYRDAWDAFTGGATVLPARDDAIAAWLEQTLGERA